MVAPVRSRSWLEVAITLELSSRFPPRATISGRVVDTNGNPVEGEYVHARKLDERPRLAVRTDGNFAMGKSGPDGSFRIIGLPLGPYSLNVERTRSVSLELTEAREYTATVVVDARDGEIRGQVIGVNGKPVLDAWVMAGLEKVDPSSKRTVMTAIGQRVRTDSDGKFVNGNLRDGSYRVMVNTPRGDSHGSKSGVKRGDFAKILLEPPGKLVVNVTYGGRPAKFNAMCMGVTVYGGDEAHDATGTHTFERLPAGEYDCTFDGDGGVTGSKVIVRPGGTAKIDVELPGWASVSGVAVSVIDGKPLSGVEFWVHGNSGTSDASGRFAIERVPSGHGQLMVNSKDQITYGVELHAYDAKPGQRVDLGTIKCFRIASGKKARLGLPPRSATELLPSRASRQVGPLPRRVSKSATG